jgi:hypothetical protein
MTEGNNPQNSFEQGYCAFNEKLLRKNVLSFSTLARTLAQQFSPSTDGQAKFEGNKKSEMECNGISFWVVKLYQRMGS